MAVEPDTGDDDDDDEEWSAANVLTPEQGRDVFDEFARTLVGMSGEEFLRRYDAGEFDAVYDDPDYWEVTHLAGLIPFARQDA